MSDVEPTSQLAGLLQIRDQLADGTEKSLVVPRWEDPQILITYRLLDQTDYAQSMSVVYDSKARKAEEIAEVSMDANRDILVKAFKRIEFKGSKLNATFTTTYELAEALGLEGQEATARNAIGRLFVADGDVLNHARRVVEWSGLTNQEIAETFSGRIAGHQAVKNAAVALVNEVDPMTYLRASDAEARVLNKVIEHAQELRAKRRDQEIQAIGAATAHALAKMFR